MKEYFVTEGNSNNYVGLNYMFKSVIDAKYFEEAKKRFEAQFVNLGELYRLLGNEDGTSTTIILSKYSSPFDKILKAKYPKAKIEYYK